MNDVTELKEDLTKLDSYTFNIQSALINQKVSGNIIQVKDSSKFPINNLRLFGKSEQIVAPTGRNLADLTNVSEGIVISKAKGAIKSNFVNDYYAVIGINNPVVLNKIKNATNTNIGFSVKQIPSDRRIGIVIFGSRKNGESFYEIPGNEGVSKIIKPFNSDFNSISSIELRLNRKYTTFTDTTTIFEEIKFWIGDEPAFEPFSNCKIVPTPENPSLVTSTGDKGNINLSVNEQKLILSTSNGLASVKEVRDEITMTERIQRIGQIASYNNEPITTDFMSSTGQLTVGAQVNYVLPNPVRTPLTPTEQEAFRKLYMNYPTTTISNDENADMELEYTVDTKSYVDTKIAEISGAVIAQKGI